MRERIEVRDAERVGHERADAGAAPRPDGNAVLARPCDEVGDDEEVAFEAHLADDFDLAHQALAVTRHRLGCEAELGDALLETALRATLEELPRRRTILGHEVRQIHLAHVDFERAALRDLDGVLDRFRQIGEQLRHLGRRA